MDSATEWLSIGAAACFIAAALILLRVHTLPTGLHPQRDAVSDYGAGAHRAYYRAMVVILGAGGALLAAALDRTGDAGGLGLAFLAAFALARIAIAFFPTDLPGRPVTTAGRVHVVLAAIAFTAIAFAAADITDSVVDRPAWSGGVAGPLRFESRAVAVTAVLTLVAHTVPAVRERAFGLIERLLYLAMLAWLLTAALHLAVAVG